MSPSVSPGVSPGVAPVGLIVGTGFADFPNLSERETLTVTTRWGDASITRATLGATPVRFVARHGADHSVPPSAINYRANIAALTDEGVADVLAVNVVGSMVTERGPGSLLAVDDFIEFTTGRAATFHDQAGDVTHTDMSAAYSPHLRALLLGAAEELHIDVAERATYVCANGPRFETPAEIRMFMTLGGDVVGMTGYPEVALAVEAGLRYAALAVVSNLAAGLFDGAIAHEDVERALIDTKEPVMRLLARTVELIAASDPTAREGEDRA